MNEIAKLQKNYTSNTLNQNVIANKSISQDSTHTERSIDRQKDRLIDRHIARKTDRTIDK